MATQQWVQERILPIETTMQAVNTKLEEMMTRLMSKEADNAETERRVEEIAEQIKNVEEDIKKLAVGDNGGNRKVHMVSSRTFFGVPRSET